MSGEVNWDDKKKRPSWNYSGTVGEWKGYDQAQLQMIESCRNILEDVLAELQKLNTLLNCRNFISIPRKLDKIVVNTTRKKRVKKEVEK